MYVCMLTRRKRAIRKFFVSLATMGNMAAQKTSHAACVHDMRVT
jgi:hypothetical protein